MKPGREPSVLWQEGTFLCPQHMQAFARELHSTIASAAGIGSPGTYGAASLSIDESALERDVVRVESAQVVFPDGTAASFPETAHVPQRDIPDDVQEAELLVYLGVPAPPPNVPQVGHDADRMTRYRVDVRATPDENGRDAERDVEFRELQGHLFFGHEERSGFETIPLARLERRGKLESKWVLSPTWVAPVIACEASGALSRRLRQAAKDVRAQARDLAAKVPPTTNLTAGDRAPDLLGVLKLQAVNQSVASIEQVANLPNLHPFAAYGCLAQTIANLSVFSESRVVPELPVYDHEQLDHCFTRAFEELDRLLEAEVAVEYDTEVFKADPLLQGIFECELLPQWLEGNPVFYLGVELAEDAQKVIEHVSGGVKLVAKADIERVLQGVVPGIGLDHLRVPPLSFPKRPGLHFFRVDSEGSSRDPWLRVLETRRAAILSALGDTDQIKFHMFVELA